MGSTSSSLPASPVNHAAAGALPPSECPMSKQQTPAAPVGGCPVKHGAATANVGECPASVGLQQSIMNDSDVDPANMVRAIFILFNELNDVFFVIIEVNCCK
jgi:hypothetical protein